MEWHNVDDVLPNDNTLVFVKCNVYSPLTTIFPKRLEWVFVGKFFRKTGWEIYFFPEHERRLVLSWSYMTEKQIS